MSRPALPEQITEGRIVPVARGLDPASAPVVAHALALGGIPVLEVTLEGDGGLAALEALGESDSLIGAGTVITMEQANDAVAAGAEFLVTPHLAVDVVEWGLAQGIIVIPAGLTPTEVYTAWMLGAPAVKLFPASVGGPDMVRALLGPYPEMRLMPTGGVTVDNIVPFLAAGAVAVGVGGWLTSHHDPDVITERARALRAAIA